MKIEILLFGPVAERAGTAETVVEVPEGASVGDALAALESAHEAVRGLLTEVAIAVNERYVGRDGALNAGDVLAVIPPVSGG